jgi:general stress protein YciG
MQQLQEATMATNKDGNKQSGSKAGQGSGTSNRGFASMDPERQREIASEGGKAAHEKGTAHEFTSEEARRAGSMSHGNRQSSQTVSQVESEEDEDQGGNRQSGQDRGSRAGASKGSPSGGKTR